MFSYTVLADLINNFAFVHKETGEYGERRLAHREEAEQFYRELKARSFSVRVRMESSGHARWFECLLHELGFELWALIIRHLPYHPNNPLSNDAPGYRLPQCTSPDPRNLPDWGCQSGSGLRKNV